MYRAVRAAALPDDQDGDPDAEPVEVIAELVEPEPCGCAGPLPPSQRALRAAEVLDSDGVPRTRSGIARRVGAPYDALAGWTPR